MEFNSKVEYWAWKNNDNSPARGHYKIENTVVHFNYSIVNIGDLIEEKDLITEENTGNKKVIVSIVFSYATFGKGFEIKSCYFNNDIELSNCIYGYNFCLLNNKFNQVFNISNSRIEANIVFIRKNEFLSSAKLYDLSSTSAIIIEECIFSDEVDFSNSVFHKRVSIKNCTFKKGVKFNRVKFFNDFLFINNEVYGCLSVENSVFEGKIELIDIKGEIGGINLNSSVIKSFLELNGVTSSLILP